jgi:hypothetical protein
VKPASVRIATTDDTFEIYHHLMVDLQGDNSLGLPPDPVDVARVVGQMCRGENGICGVIEDSEGIAASIGIRAVKPWFTSEWMLSQIWLFVVPDARPGHHHAKDLFDFAQWHREDMSARTGAPVVLENTVLSLTRLPAKTRLWARHGEQIGAVFWTRS